MKSKCCVCGVDTNNDFGMLIVQYLNGESKGNSGKKGKSKVKTIFGATIYVCEDHMTEVITSLSQPAVDYQNKSYLAGKGYQDGVEAAKSEKKLRKEGKKRQIQRSMLIEFAHNHWNGVAEYDRPEGKEGMYLINDEWKGFVDTVDAFIDYADDMFMKWHKMTDMDLKSEFIRFVRMHAPGTFGNGSK